MKIDFRKLNLNFLRNTEIFSDLHKLWNWFLWGLAVFSFLVLIFDFLVSARYSGNGDIGNLPENSFLLSRQDIKKAAERISEKKAHLGSIKELNIEDPAEFR